MALDETDSELSPRPYWQFFTLTKNYNNCYRINKQYTKVKKSQSHFVVKVSETFIHAGHALISNSLAIQIIVKVLSHVLR